jgi:EAL domain-containing protein (putative c-di-GMP-specific phosphodiesterase class I)
MRGSGGHRHAVPPAQRTADLPGVLLAADDLASGRDGDFDECVGVILAGLRQQLGFDVAFVGQLAGDTRVLRAVDSSLHDGVLRAGTTDPAEESFCARVVDGRLPEHIHDASAQPAAQTLPATRTVPVGTHLSVPIRFSDGSVYGTLCGFTCVPDPALRPRELGVMRLVARLIGRHLEQDLLPEQALRAARQATLTVLASGGPDVVFQPVRDLATLEVVGYEALSRFGDSTLPDVWFSRAATVGLGVDLEVAAAGNAIARLGDVPGDRYLAVNLSAAALCSDELVRAVDGSDLSRVLVELTEQTGVPDYRLLRERVGWLRGRGGRVAVDDAGAGHAGLQRIVEVAPDVIKLDRGLVHEVAGDQARQAMVSALAWFAGRTGATLVAEGIETDEEVAVLHDLGVRFGQGFRLGRPARLR